MFMFSKFRKAQMFYKFNFQVSNNYLQVQEDVYVLQIQGEDNELQVQEDEN